VRGRPESERRKTLTSEKTDRFLEEKASRDKETGKGGLAAVGGKKGRFQKWGKGRIGGRIRGQEREERASGRFG